MSDNAVHNKFKSQQPIQHDLIKPNINDYSEVLEACQSIADIVGELCSVPSVLIMRKNEKTMEVITSSHHLNTPYKAGDSDSTGHGLYCETVIAEQKELNVPNALMNPDWDHNPDIKLGMIAYYGVPVNWPDGVPFGTFCMLDNHENHFSTNQKQIVLKFRHVIEMLLKQAYHKQQLVKLSNTDHLTGIASRNYLQERLLTEFNRVKRYDEPVSLLFIDLDDFKAINDSEGHFWGDAVLKTFASEVNKEIRDVDLFGRYGGEEFILVLPNTELGQATQLAERIRTRIGSRIIKTESGLLKFTFSAGLVQVNENDATFEDTINRADHLMYQAKKLGRNRINVETRLAPQ